MNAVLDFPTIIAPSARPIEVADEVVGPAAKSFDVALIDPIKKVDQDLDLFLGELSKITFDLTTTAGDKAARQARLRCVKLRSAADDAYETGNAPFLKAQKDGRELRDSIKARVKAAEDKLDAQIKADEARRTKEREAREAAEATRKAGHESFIATIRAYLGHCQQPGMTAARIEAGMQMLAAIVMGPEREEYAVPAASAQCETLESMRLLHAAALGREQEEARQKRIAEENERRTAELAAAEARIAEQTAALRRQQQELEAAQARAAAQVAAEAIADAPDSAAGMAENPEQALEAAPITPDAQESGSLPADVPAPRDDAVLNASSGAEAAALPSGAEGLAAPAEVRAADPALDDMAARVLQSPLVLGDRLAAAQDVLAACQHLSALLMEAFAGRFPSHPKPDPAWWAAVRRHVEALQPRLQAALGGK